MARRSKVLRRGSPTPVTSTYTTPASSAYPSACPSEDESYLVPVSKLRRGGGPPTTGALVAAAAHQQHQQQQQQQQQQLKPKPAQKPFRFLDLPAELRLRIYAYHFAAAGPVIDLEPDNYRRIHRRMALFRANKQIYHEASAFFYSSFTFRVFPTTPGRFFKTKRPLLARLTPHQRASLTSLELRLGPGFNKPPRGWVVNAALGLAHCVRVRTVRVFVECDPSDNVFNGFRKADGYYEQFCGELLSELLAALPAVETVEFDAWKSVKLNGAMMRTLLGVVPDRYRLCWGPERGWDAAAAAAAREQQQQQQPVDAGLDSAMVASIIGFEQLSLGPLIAV